MYLISAALLAAPLYAQLPVDSRPAPIPPANQQQSVPSVDARPAPDKQNTTPQIRTAPVASTEPFDARPPALVYAEDDSRWSSSYIPVDSWIYSALLRLHGMGYIDKLYLSMRPWTRRAVLHQLRMSEPDILASGNEEALETLAAIKTVLEPELRSRGKAYGLEEGYINIRQNSGSVLRDSYHIGQSYENDYGRVYGEGFNTYDGFAARAEYGRWSIHMRGEIQHAADAEGYNSTLTNTFATLDGIPANSYTSRDALPAGNVGNRTYMRWIDAYASVHLLNHEISIGKMDNWLGPNRGGALGWSNNAESIYAFRINRVEPLHIPFVSRLLGPIRYDFFVGSLKGHVYPNSPWVHNETLSFAPTKNLQFSLQRAVIWGGKGHAPVTLHSFFHSFFSFDDVDATTKFSRNDPGARFSDFGFSYRLPFVRKWATLTVDSFMHDDATPLAAPRRAAFRAGLYMPQVPYLHKLELRAESALTDPRVSNSQSGGFIYIETVQRDGYTNKGFLLGDWIGREGKGGNFWATYHFSPVNTLEISYLRKKNAKDFINMGSTQDRVGVNLARRLRPNLDLTASVTVDRWRAPIYKTGTQNLVTGSFGLRWYPAMHTPNN